ncbi:MAG: glycosyltransferase family 2 protein [Eggerthellaceae bacterium]|nr:glycosyltransferase family 2 protein [Eggerthellaceae bacterium]
MADTEATLQPSVSVVIPVYNSEDYLLVALQSALLQDLRDIEIICVDDGSTDRSRLIIEELAEVDDRLKLVTQKRGGAGAARNAGIDAARGAFIAFLDADDWYEKPSYLRTLFEGARATGQSVAAGCFVNGRGVDDVERSFADTVFDGYEYTTSGVVDWRDFQFDYGFHRFLFARELFSGGRNRFGSLTYYEDPVFLVRILDEAGTFFATDQAHYMYRCEYKPRDWTTGNVLDLLEGVGANLGLAREKGLAKLQRYTVHHADFGVREMGIGVNPALALDVIEEKLARVERLVDQGLLAQAGESDLPFTLQLRKDLDDWKCNRRFTMLKRRIRYKLDHRERTR